MKYKIISSLLVLLPLSCSTLHEEAEVVPDTSGFGNRISEVQILTDGKWLSGDKVSLTDMNEKADFEASAGIGTGCAKFNGTFDTDSSVIYAVYPSFETLGNSINVNVGVVQSKETYLKNRIMIGVCDSLLHPKGSEFRVETKTAEVAVCMDLSSDELLSKESLASVRITVEGAAIAGDTRVDILSPDNLSASESRILYTFKDSQSLSSPVEAVMTMVPEDLSKAVSVRYELITENYRIIFNNIPQEGFSPGGKYRQLLDLTEFVRTDSEFPENGEVYIKKELPIIDLSANGTANSYIVTEAARCSFNATVMGNGMAGVIPGAGFTDYLGEELATSAEISPVSAELLWETSAGLINELMLSDGKVMFVSSERKGNALIAVRDSKGDIIWSWHIWLTDMPLTQMWMQNKSGNRYELMDRNLGALSAKEDEKSFGMSYQWGRKDPIPGTDKFYSNSETVLYGSHSTIGKVGKSVSIAESIRNPVTFYYGADWIATSNVSLWGNHDGKTIKSVYDPCPSGYMVPPEDVYSIFTKTGESVKDEADINVVHLAEGNVYKGCHLYYENYGSGPKAWFPHQGYRYYSIQNAGNLNRAHITYWTSKSDGQAGGTKAVALYYTVNARNAINPNAMSQRANAAALRCVKERQ